MPDEAARLAVVVVRLDTGVVRRVVVGLERLAGKASPQ